jgi:F-type H+-transporting ATPase subunit b
MEFETVEGLITINATLFLQIVHFLLLMFIMNRLMFRPILNLLDNRENHIVNKKEEVLKLKQDALALKEKFVRMENDARQDATRERSMFRDKAKVEADGFFEKSSAEAALIKEKAEQDIRAELEKTKSALQEHITGLADDITEKIIGRRITA